LVVGDMAGLRDQNIKLGLTRNEKNDVGFSDVIFCFMEKITQVT